jgi:hypothetical protein
MVSRHSDIFKSSWHVVIGMRNSGDEAAARDELESCALELTYAHGFARQRRGYPTSCRCECRYHCNPIAALRQQRGGRFRLARSDIRIDAALDRSREKTALLVEGFVLFVVRANCPQDLLTAIWYLAHRKERARDFGLRKYANAVLAFNIDRECCYTNWPTLPCRRSV